MTTNAITSNPAAALAAQNEAGQVARQQTERKKPPIEAPRESQTSSRYAQRQASRTEGRGRSLDTDA
jgi:hypothetical protein